MKYFITRGEHSHEVDVVERLGKLQIHVDGQLMEISYEEADRLGQVIAIHEGRSYALSVEGDAAEVCVTLAGHVYAMQLEDERERAAHIAEQAANKGGGTVKAVMPGVVVQLLVAEGEEVSAGQPLLILEAMKMQNEILAPGVGVVKTLHAESGQAVAAGDKLVTLTGEE